MAYKLLIVIMLIVFNYSVGGGVTLSNIDNNRQYIVNLSGFSELRTNIQKTQDDNIFEVRQAELDIESEFPFNTDVSFSLAYCSDNFELSSFTVEYTAYPRNNDRETGIVGLTQVQIGAGKFDIPFGIDWLVYAPVDRKLITTPLVVTNTHTCWNDIGYYVNFESRYGALSLYTTNGLSFENENVLDSIITFDSKVALGGRGAVYFFHSFTMGFSFATVFGQIAGNYMEYVGVDFQYIWHNVFWKGEYISHRIISSSSSNFRHDGYYLQGSYSMESLFFVVRLDIIDPNKDNSNDMSAISLGMGKKVTGNTEMRFEYQGISSRDDLVLLQMLFKL